MAFFDLSLDELKTYKPARTEPADFDSFWKSTLDETRKLPTQCEHLKKWITDSPRRKLSMLRTTALADNPSKAG